MAGGGGKGKECSVYEIYPMMCFVCCLEKIGIVQFNRYVNNLVLGFFLLLLLHYDQSFKQLS